MSCCNSKNPIGVSGECRGIKNLVKSIYFDPKTMKAYDDKGNYIGKVDLLEKEGIAVVKRTKDNERD